VFLVSFQTIGASNTGGRIMRITRYSDGTMRLHIEDEDDYNVTDDNGVDIWLSKKQIEQISGVTFAMIPEASVK